MPRPTYLRCGCCGGHHRIEWYGDCRDNSERFCPEELDARHGPLGWEEVDPENDPELMATSPYLNKPTRSEAQAKALRQPNGTLLGDT